MEALPDDKDQIAHFTFDIADGLKGYRSLMDELRSSHHLYIGQMSIDGRDYKVLNLQYPRKCLSKDRLRFDATNAASTGSSSPDAPCFFVIMLRSSLDMKDVIVAIKILAANLFVIAFQAFFNGKWSGWVEIRGWDVGYFGCKFDNLDGRSVFASCNYQDLGSVDIDVSLAGLEEGFYNLLNFVRKKEAARGRSIVTMAILFSEALRFGSVYRSFVAADENFMTFKVDARLIREWDTVSKHLITGRIERIISQEDIDKIEVLLVPRDLYLKKDPDREGYILLDKTEKYVPTPKGRGSSSN